MTVALGLMAAMGASAWFFAALLFTDWWRGRNTDDDGGDGGIGPSPVDPLGPEPGADWAWWMSLETYERDEVLQ